MQHHGWVGCRQPKRQLPRVLAAWQTHQHKVMLCVSCIPFALHPPAVRLSAAGKGVLVVAYNPLAWSREVPLRVPLNTSKTCGWKVTGQLGWVGRRAPLLMLLRGRGGRVWQELDLPWISGPQTLWLFLLSTTPMPSAAAQQVLKARRWRQSWWAWPPAPGACSSCWRTSTPPAPPPLRMEVGG